MSERRTILFIIEQGGYAIHADALSQVGFEVLTVTSMRKALSLLKTTTPDLIFAEFNYGPRYGVLISNLEPLLSYLATRDANIKIAVFTEKEHTQHLQTLRGQFSIDGSLIYPIEGGELVLIAEELLADAS